MRAADGRSPPGRDRAADTDRSPQAASITPGAEPVPPWTAGGNAQPNAGSPDRTTFKGATGSQFRRGGALLPPAGAHGGGEKRGRRPGKSLTKKKPGRSLPPAEPTPERRSQSTATGPGTGLLSASLLPATPPLGLHLRGRRLRRACDAPAAEERVLRLIVSDPQTGVAPGWTRGRKVRSKCR